MGYDSSIKYALLAQVASGFTAASIIIGSLCRPMDGPFRIVIVLGTVTMLSNIVMLFALAKGMARASTR